MSKETDHTWHIIHQIHWGRKWYKSFGNFRLQLVRLIDALLDFLEECPELQSFTLDGQTVVLEDYLEIRPKNRERIRALVKERRLFIGPWYVLSDEFKLSGEAFIRNLLMGKRVGDPLGGVMRVGYLGDSLRHFSQLPQLFKGFGIDSAVYFRGIAEELENEAPDYQLKGPEGSKILLVRIPTRKSIVVQPNTSDSEKIDPRIEPLLKPFSSWTQTPIVLMKSDLESYISDILEAKIASFPVLFGENSTNFHGVYGRQDSLYRKNEEAMILLEKYAEPLNVLSIWEGEVSQTAFLHYAWKNLLKKHYLNSICRSWTHSVQQALETRLENCLDIARTVRECVWDQLIGRKEIQGEQQGFSIFNPSPYYRDSLVETTVEFNRRSQSVENYFQILNKNGKVVPYQALRIEQIYGDDYQGHLCLSKAPTGRVTVLLDAMRLPPLGFRRFQIKRVKSASEFKHKVTVGRNFLENKWIRVEVRTNGLVSVLDKERNQQYEGLNLFEEGGDVGDEYNYSYPENDRIFLSKSFPQRISVVEEGPLRGAIRTRVRMKVPERATSNRKARSGKKGIVKIWSVVRLDHYSRRVEFETKVENGVKDERLRVLFPSDCRTRESYAHAPFHVIRREHRNVDPERYDINADSSLHPMQGFITVIDGERGMSLICQGIHEYELKLDNRRTLALTLMRSGRELSRGDFISGQGRKAGWKCETTEALCLVPYTFRYALTFSGSDVLKDFSPIYREAESFRVPGLSCQIKGSESILRDRSWLRIEPETLQLTALKEAEDGRGFILRILNPSNSDVEGNVVLKKRVYEVWECRLDEERLRRLRLERNRIRVVVKPWQVFTFRMIPTGVE